MCLSAVQWLHSMIWSFGHAVVVEALAIEFVPFVFAFLLLSSIIGGWNIDTADIGYRVSAYMLLCFVLCCDWLNGCECTDLLAYFTSPLYFLWLLHPCACMCVHGVY